MGLIDWLKDQTVLGDVDEWVNEQTVVGKATTWLDEQGVDAALPIAVAMAIPGVREFVLGKATTTAAGPVGAGSVSVPANTLSGWIAKGAKVLGDKIIGPAGKMLGSVPGLGNMVSSARAGGTLLPALLSTGTSLYLGGKAADAQADAARQAYLISQQATDKALALQRELFYQDRADRMPWIEKGTEALGDYQAMLSAGPGEFEASPGYQFRLSEGRRALESSALARGRVGTPLDKNLMAYGQGLASQEYGNFMNRYYQKLDAKARLAGLGGGMLSQQGQLASSYGQSAAGTILGGGQMQAQAQLLGGQARGSSYLTQSQEINDLINTLLQPRV